MRLFLLSGLLFVVIVVAITAWRHVVGRSKTPIEKDAGVMLPCEYCGVFVPADQALRDGNHVYCSTEHLHLAGKSDRKS